MCGIFGVIGSTLPVEELKKIVFNATKKIEHRGPDDFGSFVSPDGWCVLGFTRLEIVDTEHGSQPMYNGQQTVYSITNGEIYNHKELRHSEINDKPLRSNSDCEVMIPLYEKYASGLDHEGINKVFNTVKGVFATLIVDLERGQFVAARDPIGVRGMFMGKSDDGATWVASEAKALLDYCSHIEQFSPGTYISGRRGEVAAPYKQYYSPMYYTPDWLPSEKLDLQKLHDSFVKACTRRLMADVPVGVFISGGLDSSLVASITKKALPADYPFHSFSCGLEGSPDIAAAQKVADYLGTVHHVLTFTVEDGINALRDVVYHLETYDVTTIRASTPMYLLSKVCKQYVKVVLSGEGADEVFGGYLYFHNADSEKAFHDETVRRVKLLYTADVLRGDRSTAAQSLELRVPFLDRDFLDVSMGFSAKQKMTDKGKRIEKWPIRQAFSKEFCGVEYLPDEILWRAKEQFSDGVGYNWIDGLKDHCEAKVSDEMLKGASSEFPHDPPHTKEAYFYRQMFEEIFGKYKGTKGIRQTIHRWIPLWSDSDDPSGRAQKFHAAAYSKTANGASTNGASMNGTSMNGASTNGACTNGST